ncbi:MAG: LysR family transcriptional regulator [Pseudomonadales bacterium]
MDDKLKEWCTQRQWEILCAIEAEGSLAAAALKLGINRSNVSRARSVALATAARHGYAPDHDMTHPTAPGFRLRGTSTLYDSATGEAKIQWVKTTADDDAQFEAFKAAINAAAKDLPRLQPVKQTTTTRPELCNQYTFTDYHMGMLVNPPERAEKWNLDIAQDTLVKAFSHLIASAPDADECVLVQLGDFLHQDSIDAVTPTSRHLLDSAASYTQIVEASVRVLRHLIDMALAKHSKVHVIMAEGNHDISSSIWLRSMFRSLYEDEPRLTVDDSELPYYAYQFGQNMLGFTHGHLRKFETLPGLFSAQFAPMWGATTKRYAHCGHYHHPKQTTKDGMSVYQHPTLSSRDNYAQRGGWFAERQAICHTYHIDNGMTGATMVTPEMLEKS